ncbi:MAG: ABC transporter ATP-binding protein [Planctomycetes bacterium]|nr:ABC transporter ATP-binding protein [Planctomycetota bacterium]
MEAATAPWRRLRDLSRWGAVQLNGHGEGVNPSFPAAHAALAAATDTVLPDTICALQDVSFDVQPGEVVGIIGRNGAGKSTLLKILSRITEPSSGRVELHGRVGSLLEVGTGFHQELSGRENIFLNGAILGMSRREIQRRFDEIVAFAEIDRLLDTPVKRYSSGMYVRLAFAVAAHLNPEILLVDEVLAVGDIAFQKKCLGKMNEASRSGRTVLFVSHNMATVSNLCERVMVLKQGRIEFAGDAQEGIGLYVRENVNSPSAVVDLSSHPNRRSHGKPILQQIVVRDRDGHPTEQIPCGDPLEIELLVDPGQGPKFLHFSIQFEDAVGTILFTASTQLSAREWPVLGGRSVVKCSLDRVPLAPGEYCLSVHASSSQSPRLDWVPHAVRLFVHEADVYGTGRRPTGRQGYFVVLSRWTRLDRYS